MMSNIIRDIEKAYGSLQRPNWSFVARRMKEGLYDEFVSQLADVGFVQETTDQNDDCSRCLFITSGDQALTLSLSLVGKFACVHAANGRFLSESGLLSNALGERLSRLLKASGFELLGEEALRTEVELGRRKYAFYEVLFSSDGLIS